MKSLFFVFNFRFKAIANGDDLSTFFNENFPDALDLIGQEHLIQSYFSVTPAPLVSIKVIHIQTFLELSTV